MEANYQWWLANHRSGPIEEHAIEVRMDRDDVIVFKDRLGMRAVSEKVPPHMFEECLDRFSENIIQPAILRLANYDAPMGA